jgi:hypothetical protein
MGYSIMFSGAVTVQPPLNPAEVGYLRRFAGSRRMERESGPYTCDTRPDADESPDVRDANQPPLDQPSLWCHWEPTEDGREIRWNGAEKFASAEKWMLYLAQVFLAPVARLSAELADPVVGRYYAPEFEEFSFDHGLNGLIAATGEDGYSYQIEVSAGSVEVVDQERNRYPVVDTSRPQVSATRPPLRALLVGGPDDGRLVEVPRTAIQEGIPASSVGMYRLVRGPGTVATFHYQP